MNYNNKRRQKFKKLEEYLRITPFEFKNCETKTTFYSERMAERRAAELRVETVHPFRAFKCAACKNWHLTTKPLLNRKQRKALKNEK